MMPEVDTRVISARFIAPTSSGVTFEPQRLHNFKVSLFVPEVLGTQKNYVSIQSTQFYVKSITIPPQTFDVEDLRCGNRSYKIPSRYAPQSGTISFRDYIDSRVATCLSLWMQKVFNYYYGFFFPYQYKGKLQIQPLSPSGVYRDYYYECGGVWPSRYTVNDFDMSVSEQVLVSVEFQCDYCVVVDNTQK